MRKWGRFLERLQEGVLALLGHRVGGRDHEDPPRSLEWPVRGGGDHPAADLLDEVLRSDRRHPGDVRVRGRIGERAPPRPFRVWRARGHELGGERPGRG